MARPVASTIGGLLVVFDADAVLGIRELPEGMQRAAAHDACFVDFPHGWLYQLDESPEAVIAKVWPGAVPD